MAERARFIYDKDLDAYVCTVCGQVLEEEDVRKFGLCNEGWAHCPGCGAEVEDEQGS